MTKPGVEIRKEIDDQFGRHLMLINGGGIVSLLTFIQAMWEMRDKPGTESILESCVLGLLPMIVGLVLAAFSPVLRRHVSRLYDNVGESSPATDRKRRRDFAEFVSWSLQIGSLVAFFVGALCAIVGMSLNLEIGSRVAIWSIVIVAFIAIYLYVAYFVFVRRPSSPSVSVD